MRRKKPLEISKEFVEQVLAIIANESEEGRKRIVAIARRAEKKYELPVKSWLTGWFYQYTRTRGEKVEQSINIMQNFPDAYARLQEFKLMISEGEWRVGSYNYLLFLELIDSIPDYASVEESFIPSFILELKDLVMKQIDVFMIQHNCALESVKVRELERQTMSQNERQSFKYIVIFNDLGTAKEMSVNYQDKTVFCLNFKNDVWTLSWIDGHGDIFPLSLSSELVLKLAALKQPDIEKLNETNLKPIKRECIKARDHYFSKIRVIINPEDKESQTSLINDNLIAHGATSTFVLHQLENETSLWWINSICVSNKITLTDYPKLNSWLKAHDASFNEADVLYLKAHLLRVKTTHTFSAATLENMNDMLGSVFKQQGVTKAFGNKPVVKADVQSIDEIKVHSENKSKKIKESTASEPDAEEFASCECLPKKLSPERYAAMSQLPIFWKNNKIATQPEHAYHASGGLNNHYSHSI